MRKMYVRYVSVLLVLWYSLSIIGFDIHSCRSTGEVYVASLAGGVTCEDIHPEHSCISHGGCCHHHEAMDCCSQKVDISCGADHSSIDHVSVCPEGQMSKHHVCCVDKESCCSNDLQVLLLTGVHMSGNERSGIDSHHINHISDVDLAMELAMPALQRPFLRYLEHPDSGVAVPDRQAFFSIWRV